MAVQEIKAKAGNQKTVRFSKIIEDLGRPELAVLWQDPRKDSRFQSALRQNRVMTVQLKHRGTASDFGFVGFKQSPHAEYLIFPRPLNDYTDKRIVGIKYEQFSASRHQGPPAKAAEPKPKTSGNIIPTPKPRKELRFQVQIRYTATVDHSETVEAPNASQARQKAIEQTANRTPDFSKAKVERRVGKVAKVRG